jgi:hypothetical protein
MNNHLYALSRNRFTLFILLIHSTFIMVLSTTKDLLRPTYKPHFKQQFHQSNPPPLAGFLLSPGTERIEHQSGRSNHAVQLLFADTAPNFPTQGACRVFCKQVFLVTGKREINGQAECEAFRAKRGPSGCGDDSTEGEYLLHFLMDEAVTGKYPVI